MIVSKTTIASAKNAFGQKPNLPVLGARLQTSPWATLMARSYIGLMASLFLLASSFQAAADLRVCNKTSSTIGLAIGYNMKGEWFSEGWWNIDQNACETVLKGVLVNNRYLIHAIDYDKGGQWNGEAFMCTQDLEFKIKGTEECVARGFERTGFFEIDTAGKQDYTVQLTDQE